jgi:hypothetical protein
MYCYLSIIEIMMSSLMFINLSGTPRWLENNKIMNNEVPGSSIMYPLRKKQYSKAFTDPLKIGQGK